MGEGWGGCGSGKVGVPSRCATRWRGLPLPATCKPRRRSRVCPPGHVLIQPLSVDHAVGDPRRLHIAWQYCGQRMRYSVQLDLKTHCPATWSSTVGALSNFTTAACARATAGATDASPRAARPRPQALQFPTPPARPRPLPLRPALAPPLLQPRQGARHVAPHTGRPAWVRWTLLVHRRASQPNGRRSRASVACLTARPPWCQRGAHLHLPGCRPQASDVLSTVTR